MFEVAWLLGQMSKVWPWSWHSLSKRGHIRHARDPWDGEERHVGWFSFCPTKSVFSIFEVPKSGFFIFLIQVFCKICRNSSFLIFLTTRSCNITTPQMILFFEFFTIFFYYSQNWKGNPKKLPRSLEKSTLTVYLSRRLNFDHAQGQGRRLRYWSVELYSYTYTSQGSSATNKQ
jgi:hypothetical protein